MFYNDFWVPPPSLVQGHKLCREKVTMDTVCYEGGLGITKLIFQIPFLLKAIWQYDPKIFLIHQINFKQFTNRVDSRI